MNVNVCSTKQEAGRAAASYAARIINDAIARAGEANIVVATGASQFEMLDELVAQTVDWSRVTAFHLDEYIDLPASHPASFRRYLRERFVDRVQTLHRFHGIEGEGPDPAAECRRLGDLIGSVRVDLALVGVGENGHLAFNDPPADFDTEDPFIVVALEKACRKQQVGEGWFSSIAEVPTHAISMTIRQMMKAECIICTVPDLRKAQALKNTVEGAVTPDVPASILQRHPDCHLFVDEPAASLLRESL